MRELIAMILLAAAVLLAVILYDQGSQYKEIKQQQRNLDKDVENYMRA